MSVTVGKLTAVAQAIPQLATDMATAGLDLSNLAADAVVGEDILSVVAVFWPPAALLAEALAIAVAIAPLFPAIHLSPDQLPMTDAQTTQGRGGRNG